MATNEEIMEAFAKNAAAIVGLEAENDRLRARLNAAKHRLVFNTPKWAHEWPGIKGAIEEIDDAFEGGPLSSK